MHYMGAETVTLGEPELRQKIGELARKAEVLQSQITLLEKQIASPPGGIFNKASATTRLAALKDQMAAITNEGSGYLDRLEAITKKPASVEDIVALREGARSAEWLSIAQKSGLTQKQIDDIRSYSGRALDYQPPSTFILSGKTMLIVAGVAIVGLFLLRK